MDGPVGAARPRPLPVVGDPITVVAGIVRVPFGLFVAVVIPLRVGRYLLIAGLL